VNSILKGQRTDDKSSVNHKSGMSDKTNSSASKINTRKKRIGLITPYKGFNLGDGAIQDEIIHKLKGIDHEVECFGITLYPIDTEHRHGITSFPATGLIVQNYSETELLFAKKLLPPHKSLNDDEVAESKGDHDDGDIKSPALSLLEGLRNVKNIPLIGQMLRYIVFRLRDIKKILIEFREIVHAIKFVLNLDLLVISGGGQLDEADGGRWGHPYVMFRWAIISKLTRTPFAVVSVGSGRLNTGLTRWFVQQTLGSAIFRSYRDRGTRDQLSYLAFTKDDPIVRDLALGMDPAPYCPEHTGPGSQRCVAINPIYQNMSHYGDFVECICDFIQWLIERGDRVQLFRTTSIERLVIRDIWRELKKRYGNDTPDQIEEIQTSGYHDMMKQIVVADLIVASRLHAVILSHVINKPVLAISWDRKVTAHMEDMEQTRYMIDIDSINSAVLKSVFEDMEKDSDDIRMTLHNRIKSFQPELAEQYKQLLQIIS
jgi:polysaccharide pyruvyl transferase WcaK-like protein